MKNLANGLLFTSRAKRVTHLIAACTLFLIFSQHQAFGQWKLASGFSNVNASLPNEVDQISGFVPWGTDLLADAKCAIDLQIGPGPTPDSLFISTDHGQTWASLCANGGVPFLAMGSGSVPILVGGASLNPTDINLSDEVLSYSIDGGQTWNSDTAGWFNPGGNGLASSLASIGSTIFMSDPFGVSQQSAPGGTWTVDTSGLNLGPNISTVGTLAASGNNLFLSTGFNGIFVSTNQGASWSSANSGLSTYTSFGSSHYYQSDLFAVSESSVFIVVAHDTDEFGNNNFDTADIYRTGNSGQSWNKVSSSLPNWGNLYHLAAFQNSVFAATDSGFYVSNNNGSTWVQQDQGLQLVPGDFVTSIQISGGNIVIGTNTSGAWYRKLSDFGISSVAESIVPNAGLNLALSENPASSAEVKVTYTLSDAGAAQVELMDELGRSVRMLQNGPSVPGENILTIDPLSLAAGTYFVRLTAGGASSMQKLVITR